MSRSAVERESQSGRFAHARASVADLHVLHETVPEQVDVSDMAIGHGVALSVTDNLMYADCDAAIRLPRLTTVGVTMGLIWDHCRFQ